MKHKYTVLGLVSVLFYIFTFSTQAFAATDEENIEAFVRKLYQAKIEGDEALLASYGASQVQIASALVILKCGGKEYHDIQTYIYPCEEDVWLVLVGYELETEGVSVRLPGVESLYVLKKDGEYRLPWQKEEYDGELVNEQAELMSTDPELLAWMETYNDAYNKLLQNDDTVGEISAYIELIGLEYDKMLLAKLGQEMYTEEQSPVEQSVDTIYTVRAGDCLWGIAEEYLGIGGKWELLYEKNRSVIGHDPNLILPGQQIDVGLD